MLASLITGCLTRAQERGVGVTQSGNAAAREAYYALVIGNDAYVSLPKLKTAVADAREVERVLRESYGFQTKLLLNATRSQIVASLSAYRRELGPDANLLIYYAGHGYNDKDANKAYWLPVDAALGDSSNWIIADEITTGIRVIQARHVLVISDSCYSGTLTRELPVSPRAPGRDQFLQKMAAGRSRTLMSSGGDEPVVDGGGAGHSVFAAALLRGLRSMDKPRFTAGELFNTYVIEAVAGQAEQTPAYDPLRNSGHESGDFIFARVKGDGKSVEVAASPPTAKAEAAAYELSFWNTIKDSRDQEDFKDYLAKYPYGQFASLARRRIAALKEAANNSEAAAAGAPTRPGTMSSPVPAESAGREDSPACADGIRYPSTRYQTQRTALFAVSIPADWQQFGDERGSVSYAPAGAQSSRGVTHGVIFSVFQSRYGDFQDATREFINALLQGDNNYLRQASGFQRTTLDGRDSLATTFTGRSPITGRTERVTVVVTQLTNRQVFYMVAVSPQDEYASYQRTFNAILRSLQLNSRY